MINQCCHPALKSWSKHLGVDGYKTLTLKKMHNIIISLKTMRNPLN
jgi:hypothetical protein